MKIIKNIAITLLIILLISLSAVIFKFTAPIKMLDFSNSGELGSAISGLTTPAIGLLSTVLLYLALTKQTQSNIDQRIKNESDIIFLLINNLDEELNRFYTNTSTTQGKVKNEYIKTGIQGLMSFTRFYKFELNQDFFDGNKLTFRSLYESHQIELLIDSFALIEKRISISTISLEMKQLFKMKLSSYYQCKFRLPLKYLTESFEKYGQSEQEYPKKIIEFVNSQNYEGEIFD